MGYDSRLLFGSKGWLSASGTFGSIDATDSKIRFDKFWWTVLSGVGKKAGEEGGASAASAASAAAVVVEGGAAGAAARDLPISGGQVKKSPAGESGAAPSSFTSLTRSFVLYHLAPRDTVESHEFVQGLRPFSARAQWPKDLIQRGWLMSLQVAQVLYKIFLRVRV